MYLFMIPRREGESLAVVVWFYFLPMVEIYCSGGDRSMQSLRDSRDRTNTKLCDLHGRCETGPRARRLTLMLALRARPVRV